MEYRFHPCSVMRANDASEEGLLEALKAARTAYEEATSHTRLARREKYRRALHEFVKYTMLKTVLRKHARENVARLFRAWDIGENVASVNDARRHNHEVTHSEPATPTSYHRSRASQSLMNTAETILHFEPRSGVHLILHFPRKGGIA